MYERAQLRALVHDAQSVSTTGIGRSLPAVKAIAGRVLRAAPSSWRASMTGHMPLLDIDALRWHSRGPLASCDARNRAVAHETAHVSPAGESDPYEDVCLAEAHGRSPTVGRGVLLEHASEVLVSLAGVIDEDTQLPYRAA